MKKIFFRYKVHPGDLLRNTDVIELPNPNDNLEDFLIWFLHNYQSDNRIAYLDDLSKLIDNEFSSEEDRADLIKKIGHKTDEEMQEEINLIEDELKKEAFENFYQLLLLNKIEILGDDEK
jgi:hypothetical protein